MFGAARRLGAGALPLPGPARCVDALVDLPFALPTAVAGIALTALYAEQRLARPAASSRSGIKVAFTPLGIVVALIFIGLPFVVRTVQPVLRGPRRASSRKRRRRLGAGALADLLRA